MTTEIDIESVADAITKVLQEELSAELAAMTQKHISDDFRNFGESLYAPDIEEQDYWYDSEPLIAHFPAVNVVPGSRDINETLIAGECALRVDYFVLDSNDGRVPRLLDRYGQGIQKHAQ